MRRIFEFALPVLWLLGCSGGGSGDDSSSTKSGAKGPVSQGNFVSQLSQAMCGGISGCCQQAGFGYNRSNCETILNGLYGGVLQDVTSSADFDEQLAGDCIAQVRADSSSCNFTNFGGDSCATVFSSATANSRKRGEACGQSCVRSGSGTSCYVEGNDPGECYREDGLYCDSTTSQCARLVADGDQCSTSQACSTGYCVSTVCVPKLPKGSDCGFDDTACEDGLVCEFSSGQCMPKGKVGADCIFDGDCESDYCDTDGTCAEGADNSQLLAIACGG
jgi:hypothetical protein